MATRIGVSSGLEGYFVIMYNEIGPLRTGFIWHNYEDAVANAIIWAKAKFKSNWEDDCDYNNEV